VTDRSEGDAFERTGRALYLFHRNKDSVVTPSREKWSKEKSNHCRMENPVAKKKLNRLWLRHRLSLPFVDLIPLL